MIARPKCASVLGALSAYVDDRLDVRQSRFVREHLARCRDCDAELAALASLSRAAAALPVRPPAAGLADRVRAQVARAQRKESAGTVVLIRAAASILVVLGLVLAYQFGRERGRADGRVEPVVSAPPTTEPELLPGPPVAIPVVRPGGLRPVPPDETAVRAARSLFADLEMIDSIPVDLREPLLRSQMQHFDLDRWATTLASDAPADREPVVSVAHLVRDLDSVLDDGLTEDALVGLRRRASRPDLWTAAAVFAAPTVEVRDEPGELDRIVEDLGADLAIETRRSLGEWLAFKDDWVQGGGDFGDLEGLLRTLGGHMDQVRPSGNSFALPDLEDLHSRIQWTTEPDGTRRGVLRFEDRTQNGYSSFSLSVQSSSSRSGD